MSGVRIDPAAADAMIAHAWREAPRECCGVLIGRGDDIHESVATGNLAGAANRFLIDPRGHIAARRDARSRRLDVVGFYHSHPLAAAVPSARDLAEASYDGYYAIVSLEHGQADLRLYRFAGGAFEQVAAAIDRCRSFQAGA